MAGPPGISLVAARSHGGAYAEQDAAPADEELVRTLGADEVVARGGITVHPVLVSRAAADTATLDRLRAQVEQRVLTLRPC
jgi:hypothetical protein